VYYDVQDIICDVQGALYVVLGENKRSLVTKRNWEVISGLWSALVQAQLRCEKPSLLKLFDIQGVLLCV